MRVTVVAGNPKPSSRTLAAARTVAESVAPDAEITEIDVIGLGAALLGWGDEAVRGAVATVAASDLAVIASPTFKATYTGVLKLFLDQFGTCDGMRGVVAVPLMLGAGPGHAMSPDLLLRPVLTELGAVCPAPGLYLLDTSYTTDGRIADYTERWGTALLQACALRPEQMTEPA